MVEWANAAQASTRLSARSCDPGTQPVSTSGASLIPACPPPAVTRSADYEPELVVLLCLNLILENSSLRVSQRMVARELRACDVIEERLSLGKPVIVFIAGGLTEGIPVSQSSFSLRRMQDRLGKLAHLVTWVPDEQSRNTLENLVELWKILPQLVPNARRVPIHFVTDISHLRAIVLPQKIFSAPLYALSVHTASDEENLDKRIHCELNGIEAMLEAVDRAKPDLALAPALYAEIKTRNMASAEGLGLPVAGGIGGDDRICSAQLTGALFSNTETRVGSTGATRGG